MLSTDIRRSYEALRGCGYRKAGGMYLVTRGQGRFCGRLPVKLDICPTCGGGIRPSRAWTWVDLRELIQQECASSECNPLCPLSPKANWAEMAKIGLIWIGERFYPTPHDWLKEAGQMGISRRITAVPRGFEIGKSWVAVAHRKAFGRMKDNGMEYSAAIFHVFRPEAIEYIIRGDEKIEDLQSLKKRGIDLVEVHPEVDEPLFQYGSLNEIQEAV